MPTLNKADGSHIPRGIVDGPVVEEPPAPWYRNSIQFTKETAKALVVGLALMGSTFLIHHLFHLSHFQSLHWMIRLSMEAFEISVFAIGFLTSLWTLLCGALELSLDVWPIEAWHRYKARARKGREHPPT